MKSNNTKISGSLVTRNNRKRESRLKQSGEKRAKTIENEIRSEKSLKLDVTSMSSTRRIRCDLFILRAASALPDPIGNCVYLSSTSTWSWPELLFFLILSMASTSRSCVCDLTTEASVRLLMVWHRRLVCDCALAYVFNTHRERYCCRHVDKCLIISC